MARACEATASIPSWAIREVEAGGHAGAYTYHHTANPRIAYKQPLTVHMPLVVRRP